MHREHKKLERLMLFSEVAQHLSFTVAAAKLVISRGHLSAQIRRLEKDMGIPLFIRSTRSVRLTPEGERVLAGMQKIRHSLLELERNADRENHAIEGLIKITAPTLFTDRYLLDIVSQFKSQHPMTDFSIDCSYTSYDLNRSDFDLAFRATNTPPQNMVAKSLISYQHVCCASPDYFSKNGTPKTPDDLIHHQCFRGQDQTTWAFKTAEVSVNGWLQINDNHLLKRLAIAGRGIIRAPDYLIDRELTEGKLEAILENETLVTRAIYMVYPQLIHQSKRLAAFIAFTHAYFEE